MPMADIALQLPFDFYRTPGTETRLACHAFPLTVPENAPAPEALLAAAFGVLLHRYSAQPSITLNASRIAAGGEVRWRRPLDLSTATGADGHAVLGQAGAFLRLDGEAAPAGRTAGAAITFLESWSQETLLAHAARENPGDDLHLVVARGTGTVRAAFLYNANLFKRTSVERFAGHLRELAARLAAEPGAPIAKLTLLGPAERIWIESMCDGPARQAPAEFVHLSFEKRAAETPEATAIRWRDRSLAYGELNARANALARSLTASGLAAEDRVAVVLEPSFDVVVALLAVLKAGAVYVPLDPGYPPARMSASLEDIQPRLVLTRERFDEVAKAAEGLSGDNLGLPVRPQQTAYIYYTSGTTGKPKGAAASQANLASYIRAARERYQIAASDVMPAIARFSFSISMFELMSPLAAGGTLLVLDRDHILDLDRMARTLAETTLFHAGPSLLKNLVAHIKRRYPDLSPFSKVRHASSGGDMVSPELLEALKEIFVNAEVFVIYGCSEISCMGCTYPVARDRPLERTYVGRPFDNMAVRVLDGALNLLPVGVVGEIHFAGDGIVKGYLNRPELTAEKFVVLDGRRFYRTGDMGRLSEDGWLEILGRSDFQVKLRGIRVELGEVEHNLRRAPGVRDGVVIARETGGEKSLAAYVVLEKNASVDAVRRYMTEHVPDYMVPSLYVELEKLPLNHNMKVDRRALPEPSPLRGDDARRREPRTDTEKRLAALWTRLLAVEHIGLDDNFFDLGGHSALGIKLILDIDGEFGTVLTGMQVLREPLQGQAALIDRRLGKAFPAPGSIDAAPGDEFESFHFGEGGSLYGVLSGRVPAAGEAVLICAPVGQEHLRAHFILRRLAQRLAARGVPALRFDWYGTGDSLGDGAAATCSRWRRDIGDAYRELARRTGATRITAVGARLGAALLGAAAPDLELAALVAWDPVRDGAAYLAELAAADAAFAPGWRRLFRSPPARPAGETELLGLVCSAANARELKALAFPPKGGPSASLKFHATPECVWNDAARLGDLLPDVGISAALAALATERA
jgi:amino acid adenylation domain-containing protein